MEESLKLNNPSLNRPFGDGLVDLAHQADGLVEGDDDALVVADVLARERATFTVFEPLVADLVAADLEVPHRLGDAAEVLGRVDPHPAVFVARLHDDIIAADGVGGDEVFDQRAFEQVQVDQFFALFHERGEEGFIAGERDAREIDLEELGVARAVRGTVKD